MIGFDLFLYRLLGLVSKVQRSQAAGSAMMSFPIWLSRQHQITNEGLGGVAGREVVDEELERNSDLKIV